MPDTTPERLAQIRAWADAGFFDDSETSRDLLAMVDERDKQLAEAAYHLRNVAEKGVAVMEDAVAAEVARDRAEAVVEAATDAMANCAITVVDVNPEQTTYLIDRERGLRLNQALLDYRAAPKANDA